METGVYIEVIQVYIRIFCPTSILPCGCSKFSEEGGLRLADCRTDRLRVADGFPSQPGHLGFGVTVPPK